MAAAEAAGGSAEVAVSVAAAVELIHTYSLVHDDLPCMDDDPMRRGAPSVHVAFDEATAVLAGDALLALAFEAVASAEGQAPDRVARAVLDLALAAGSRGLVGGQADDLTAERPGAILDQPGFELIHERKSAALIAASIVAGARVADADADLLQRLHAFGICAGVAFQIADDCEDGDGLARLLGPVQAAARAESLLARALKLVEDLGERAEPLRELARFAVRREP
jgi:geranylgeranyl pyrophosphate synthase